MITIDQVEAVNRRIDELVGPFQAWEYCPHGPDDACECRKPKPKMIFDAARKMGVNPSCCVVIGDKDSDVEAARRAGAQSVFVDDAYGVVDAIESILANSSHPAH